MTKTSQTMNQQQQQQQPSTGQAACGGLMLWRKSRTIFHIHTDKPTVIERDMCEMMHRRKHIHKRTIVERQAHAHSTPALVCRNICACLRMMYCIGHTGEYEPPSASCRPVNYTVRAERETEMAYRILTPRTRVECICTPCSPIALNSPRSISHYSPT